MVNQGFETGNETLFAAENLNFSLCKYLVNCIQRLPPDGSQSALQTLLEALRFALLRGEHPTQLRRRIRRERRAESHSWIPLDDVQAQVAINEVKHLRALARVQQAVPGGKKLDKFRQEIQALHQRGASLRDIQFWLFNQKHVTVSAATVQRYVKVISPDG